MSPLLSITENAIKSCPYMFESRIYTFFGCFTISYYSIISTWHMWLNVVAFISVLQRFSFQSPPAGWESSQSLPPEAVRARLAAISKRVPVGERSFCWPTAPSLLTSKRLKLLEKSAYTHIHTHNRCCSIRIQVFSSSASDLQQQHLFIISPNCTLG